MKIRTPLTPTERAHIRIHAEAPPVAVTMERAHGSQRGYCCAANATTSEPRGPCVMQKRNSGNRYIGRMWIFVDLCCCVLRAPGMRSDDACWGIDTQQQAATAASGRRWQSQQQPVAVNRSRSSSSVHVSCVEKKRGYP